jgi:hypothetical protein
MRIFGRGRLWTGAAVILAAAPVATTSFVETASAVSFSVGGVVCTTLHGNGSRDTANLKGCTAAPTGGTGGIINFMPSGGNVIWANGTTTNYTATYTNPTTGCPAGDGIYKITGTVTSGTNPATPIGQLVKMKICVSSTLVLTNAPGTNVKF